MSPDTKQRIQVVLAIAIAVAAIRTAYIFYQRHEANVQTAKAPPPPLNPDYYVTPKKLYPYDLKSARQLEQQPVWVKEGYRYTYYPYRDHHADFAHAAGQLLPIQKLQVEDVVLDVAPGSPGEKQLMAVFEDQGKSYALPIGTLSDGNYQIYSDEIFYVQDPHELYKHWPPEVWQAIEQHQVKPGMNELQADFAIGMGVPEPGDAESKTVNYPNGGKPLKITYQNGRAADIQAGTSPAG
jgi:hypothetical protein